MGKILILEKLDKNNSLIYIHINKMIWIKTGNNKRVKGDKTMRLIRFDEFDK